MNLFARHALRVGVLAISITCSSAFADQTVKATLLANGIQLSATSVKAGAVTIDVSNGSDGNLTHELVVLKTDMADDKLQMSNGKVLEKTYKKMGEVEDIVPGKNKRLTLRLAPGHYVLICNEPGHYAMGMHTSLLVGS
jgi:uncharacterized cupredoxin-like copper-binding protein